MNVGMQGSCDTERDEINSGRHGGQTNGETIPPTGTLGAPTSP